jgi:hypothetical protein
MALVGLSLRCREKKTYLKGTATAGRGIVSSFVFARDMPGSTCLLPFDTVCCRFTTPVTAKLATVCHNNEVGPTAQLCDIRPQFLETEKNFPGGE